MWVSPGKYSGHAPTVHAHMWAYTHAQREWMTSLISNRWSHNVNDCRLPPLTNTAFPNPTPHKRGSCFYLSSHALLPFSLEPCWPCQREALMKQEQKASFSACKAGQQRWEQIPEEWRGRHALGRGHRTEGTAWEVTERPHFSGHVKRRTLVRGRLSHLTPQKALLPSPLKYRYPAQRWS